jgi:hypothetical protein
VPFAGHSARHNGYGACEFVVTPHTTCDLVQHIDDDRRIFTDGRDWPAAYSASETTDGQSRRLNRGG